MNQQGDNEPGESPITAAELAERYEQDPVEADEDFLGNQLTVSGEIDRIDNVISAVVPRMLGTGEKYSGTHVKIHLKNRGDTVKLSEGDSATVRGTCRGLEKTTSPTGDEIGWITIESARVKPL